MSGMFEVYEDALVLCDDREAAMKNLAQKVTKHVEWHNRWGGGQPLNNRRINLLLHVIESSRPIYWDGTEFKAKPDNVIRLNVHAQTCDLIPGAFIGIGDYKKDGRWTLIFNTVTLKLYEMRYAHWVDDRYNRTWIDSMREHDYTIVPSEVLYKPMYLYKELGDEKFTMDMGDYYYCKGVKPDDIKFLMRIVQALPCLSTNWARRLQDELFNHWMTRGGVHVVMSKDKQCLIKHRGPNEDIEVMNITDLPICC